MNHLTSDTPSASSDASLGRRNFLKASGAAALLQMAAKSAEAQPKEGSTPPAMGKKSLVVDCQSHLFLPEVLDMMRKRNSDPVVYEKDGVTILKMGDWLRKVPAFYLDVNAKLAAMDACGIDITMLSTNDPGPEWFGTEGPAAARLFNDSVASIVAQHPTRFRGLCVLPLQDEAAADRELDRCVKQLGMKGILLYTNLAGAWPDEPQFRWMFARAEELGLPVLLHPALPMTTEQVKGYELTSTLGNMFENTISLARIVASGLLDVHPRLKLVCPHLGGTLPYICGRMDHQIKVLKRSNQNLQRKPSEYLRSIYMDIVSPLPEAMEFAIKFSGPDRLLFSSDHPWVEPSLILEDLRSLNLPAETESKILGTNAQQLFNL
ncbi:amidohydrolase family protein [Planctomicrobium sp. SH664]|uniref:amidohydrolase family protein n=1 Tax=Planctomicrobium sp. SH664 TaxID=3448125 RepID=UPI003F5B7B9A